VDSGDRYPQLVSLRLRRRLLLAEPAGMTLTRDRAALLDELLAETDSVLDTATLPGSPRPGWTVSAIRRQGASCAKSGSRDQSIASQAS
jgi:hypothetical protein